MEIKVAGTTITLSKNNSKKEVYIEIPKDCLETMSHDQIVELFALIATVKTRLEELLPKDWRIVE